MITYTYDAKDRLTGTRNSRDGVTETTTSDYVYDGKTVTYTEKTWAGETLWNSQKFKRTYLDDALEKVLEERITDKDDHIIQRICNEYDHRNGWSTVWNIPEGIVKYPKQNTPTTENW